VVHKNNPKAWGVWHGTYAVRSSSGGSRTVLQECGLLTEWVESEFSPPFRDECKDIAAGNSGKRNPKAYLFVPAGEVHDTKADPPPPSELLPHATVEYLQGNEDSCLRQSMASALHAMGFGDEAKVVASDATMLGCTVDLVPRAAAVVKKVFVKLHLEMKKLYSHACSIEQIGTQDAAWFILLILQTSDGCNGSHAVTTWNGMIYDSNSPHAMRWSQLALDWCSGLGSTCIGFSRAYRICPAHYGESVPHSKIHVGAPLRPIAGTSAALRWVMLLPTNKRKGRYLVRHTNGVTESMLPGMVDSLLVPSETVSE
jgi:hypothetical protein